MLFNKNKYQTGDLYQVVRNKFAILLSNNLKLGKQLCYTADDKQFYMWYLVRPSGAGKVNG